MMATVRTPAGGIMAVPPARRDVHYQYFFRPPVNTSPDGSCPPRALPITWYRASPLSETVRPVKYSRPPPRLNPGLVSDSPSDSPLSLNCRKYAPAPAPTNGCHLPPSQL